MIKRIRMPGRDGGGKIPAPVRYLCDRGHLHPSRNHAVKCHQRKRKAERTTR